MKKYLFRGLRIILCTLITILMIAPIMISQMGPIGDEPGGRANRKGELGMIDWVAKLWEWSVAGDWPKRDSFYNSH